MLQTYRAVFRPPGTAAFCAAGVLMRLPIAMYPLGLVLTISARTGHYSFAGVLSGCYIVGSVPGNPILGRLVDRHGQRRVMIPATAVHVAAVAVLAGLLEAHAPDWTLLAPTVVAGFAYVSVISLIRARWAFVLNGRPELTTAFSLESALDEFVFIVGPLLATLIATQVDPVLVLVLSGAFVASGMVWLASLRATEPPSYPRGTARQPSAMRVRGMVLLTLAATAMGAIFAGAEVSIVAFCGQHGLRSASGGVLACFALGSGSAGIAYGARHWRAPLLTRFVLNSVVFAVLTFVFLAGFDVPVLAACAFVVGIGIAPTLITAFELIERIVPAARLTEGIAWLTTGINLGYGAAAATGGRIADAHGARSAFGVAIAAGIAMAVLAIALTRRLRAASLASEPVHVGG